MLNEFPLLNGWTIGLERVSKKTWEIFLVSPDRKSVFSLGTHPAGFWADWTGTSKKAREFVSKIASRLQVPEEQVRGALERVYSEIKIHPLKTERKGQEGGQPAGGGPEPERKTDFEVLLELTRAKLKELFRDEEGEVCAVIEQGGHQEVWPVGSKEFDALLNRWFYESQGRGVREEVRKDVVATLEAEGFDKPVRQLNLFCALEENPEPTILVDLFTPDWRGVKIDASGISVIPLPPIFRRFAHLTTWEPEIPFQGDPKEVIQDFFRRTIPEPEDPDTYDLLTPALPTLLLPIPRPIWAGLGGHGSAKSVSQSVTTMVFLRSEAVSARGDDKDFAVVARQNPILRYDNIRSVNEELARFLCVLVTGERVGFRELYSDREAVYMGFKRAVFLNGISPNITAYPDLMDRILLIKYRRIPEEKLKPEDELKAELLPLYPKVFSACLEALRRAIPHLKKVREDLKGKLPRMADFAIWSEAVARGMGYRENDWFKLYKKWLGETVKETVESSPLGRALLKLAELLKARLSRGELQERKLEDAEREALHEAKSTGLSFLLAGVPAWVGTPSALLSELESKLIDAGENLDQAREEHFPSNPSRLGVQLKNLQSSLQDLGIKVLFKRAPSGRLILIQLIPARGDGMTEMTEAPYLLPPNPQSICEYGMVERGEERGEGVTIKALPSFPSCPSSPPQPSSKVTQSRAPEPEIPEPLAERGEVVPTPSQPALPASSSPPSKATQTLNLPTVPIRFRSGSSQEAHIHLAFDLVRRGQATFVSPSSVVERLAMALQIHFGHIGELELGEEVRRAGVEPGVSGHWINEAKERGEIMEFSSGLYQFTKPLDPTLQVVRLNNGPLWPVTPAEAEELIKRGLAEPVRKPNQVGRVEIVEMGEAEEFRHEARLS